MHMVFLLQPINLLDQSLYLQLLSLSSLQALYLYLELVLRRSKFSKFVILVCQLISKLTQQTLIIPEQSLKRSQLIKVILRNPLFFLSLRRKKRRNGEDVRDRELFQLGNQVVKPVRISLSNSFELV